MKSTWVILIMTWTVCICLHGPNVCRLHIRGGLGVCFHSSRSFGWFHNPYPRFYCCKGFFEDNDMCKSKQCPAGRYGPACLLFCPAGKFGINCIHQCRCQETEVCRKDSGCICKDGFIGPKCKEVCQPGRYGNQCKMKCNCAAELTCDPETGKCNCEGDLIKGICIAASTVQLYEVDSTTTISMDTTTNEQDIPSIGISNSSKHVLETSTSEPKQIVSNISKPIMLYNLVILGCIVFIWLVRMMSTIRTTTKNRKKYIGNIDE